MFRKGRNFLLGATMASVAFLAACDDDGGTDPIDTTPNAPTGLTATATGQDVVLSWSGSGDSFVVSRQPVGGSFAQIASGVTGTTYTDTGVAPGTYSYHIEAVANGRTSSPSASASVEVGEAVVTISGDITGTRTLSADTLYMLQGIVTVVDGGELHIPAGTQIQGDISIQPTALIVRTGGKIFSEGTASDPVVFTSSAPVGERRAGDWGGVVINGLSICNFPADQCVGEGSSGTYGGSDQSDNSGKMFYTRIEFAGYELSFGNELNALTLNGVGSGTELHHIQTNVGLDDGIEFFGGTVDLKYALVTNASDDSFDFSTGWQGRGQFWIAQQDPNDADQGFEVDGNEDNADATPFTDPVIYNVTLVGNGPGGAGGDESDIGMLLRDGTAGKIYNAIVMGFGEFALDIDNAETVGRVELRDSIFASNAASFSDDDDGIDEAGFFNTAAWMNREADDAMLADPYNRDTPDFTPLSGSPALTGAATPPTDDFFTVTDFVGAADPNGPKWWEGWTSFVRN